MCIVRIPDSISIVIPTYKSAGWVEDTIDAILEVLQENFVNYEVVLVNDGGDTATYDKIKKQADLNEFIQVINCPMRVGQQQATWLGIKKAIGNIIITIDDDGEFPPEGILHLYNLWNETNDDIVYGIPNTLKKSGIKMLLYRIYLWNLQQSGEARKSSFRLLNRLFINRLNKPLPDYVLNIDVYFESYFPLTSYIGVNYTPSENSRYSLWDYFKVLRTVVKYKQTLKK